MAPPFLVTGCCRIMSLRTGSLAIAYTYLVFDLVLSSAVVSGAAFLEAAKSKLDEAQARRLPDIQDTEGVMVGLWFLLLPFITFLLVGLHKNKFMYVKVYLLGVFPYILLEITLFCMNILFYRMNYYILTARAISIVVQIYFFAVVRSQYYKMIQGPET